MEERKVFLSMPMNGKTNEQVRAEMEKVQWELQPGDVLMDTVAADIPSQCGNEGLYCLGKNLGLMSEADLVLFAPGWHLARGCRIEHECAVHYGKPMGYVTPGRGVTAIIAHG